MSTTLSVPGIGPLERDEQFDDLWVSEPVAVPYFDGKPLELTLEDPLDQGAVHADFVAAVAAFLSLSPADRLAASPYVFRNYQAVGDAFAEPGVSPITRPEDVWAQVRATHITVSRRHRHDRAVYVQISANCDWEPEHGLQIIYRRGQELSRVSQYDGHLTHADAYDLLESEDRICEE